MKSIPNRSRRATVQDEAASGASAASRAPDYVRSLAPYTLAAELTACESILLVF